MSSDTLKTGPLFGRKRRLLVVAVLLFVHIAGPTNATTGRNVGQEKRPIKVADLIDMNLVVDAAQGSNYRQNVALFSPDRRHFVVLIRNGNLKDDTNEFSMLLFRTATAFASAHPVLLAKMGSSSNRDGISHARWLSDSKTIVFLGEHPGERAQVYSVNIDTRRVVMLIHHPTSIINYEISRDGRTVLFEAEAPKEPAIPERIRRAGIVVRGQELEDLVARNYSLIHRQVFVRKPGLGTRRVTIPEQYEVSGSGRITLEPGGRYALIGARVRDIPDAWAEYRIADFQGVLSGSRLMGEISPLGHYFVLDLDKWALSSLLDAPMVGLNGTQWAEDGQSVFLHSYLPLEGTTGMERERRRSESYAVEVRLPKCEFRKVQEEDWPKEPDHGALEVSVEQDLNTPPALWISDRNDYRRSRLLELNPQFRDLELGEVRIIEWKVGDVRLLGGLYLPPNYVPGQRYPLVIQTHGFEPGEFSMDGRSEWASAFMARPLAAEGIAVLQAYEFKDRSDHGRVASDQGLGSNDKQRFKVFFARAIEGAIDHLDQQGLIDREQVGIVGFSRTVCFTAYTLTHSQYHFRAAGLVDGIDCGYFQEIAFAGNSWDFDQINGGTLPFGEGLRAWLAESPSFHLQNVSAPVRLVSLGAWSVLETWEWYAALSLQRKPVELTVLPEAQHLVRKPSERLAVQEGFVDWFRFWLRGDEIPDPEKPQEYARWEELRRRMKCCAR